MNRKQGISLQLFYDINISEKKDGSFRLNEADSQHAVKVLRLGAGDKINITDGNGNLYSAQISEKSHFGCLLNQIQKVKTAKRKCLLSVCIAAPKKRDRLEWLIEKLTELGVGKIVFLKTVRSERSRLNMERVNKLVISAMKQSLQLFLPEIQTEIPLKDINRYINEDIKLIAHCINKRERIHLKNVMEAGKSSAILIGPEGDFTQEEVELAKSMGYTELNLGKDRLRTETAAIMAASAFKFINQN